jgi:hypothetical protein
MSTPNGNHIYLALILAIAAAFSSSPHADGLYQRVSQMMLTNSGMEAGIDMAEAPDSRMP